MLCVTLAHGSHHRMIQEHEELARERIPLAELRLDLLRKEPQLNRFLPTRPTPVVVTVRREKEGGFWKDTEEKRLRLLRSAIVEGADYVDLEMDIAGQVPRFGKTKRVVSYHNMEETPQDLLSLHKQMSALDPDIIKIAVMPKGIKDVFRMLAFLQKVNAPGAKVPTVGISMGEMGTMTRILSNKFGCPYTYACFSSQRKVAPGMVDFRTMRDLYRHDRVNRETQVYGVIADPVGHSLSPLIHNASFAECKLNKVYLPFLVHPEDLSIFMKNASAIDLKGLSVTIPHKVAMIQELTLLEPAVEEINACNTVVIRDGQILGDNTDYVAAAKSIEKAMGRAGEDGVSPIEGKRALILGAGGAGKAVAYGLKKRGAIVVMTDGNEELAQSVCRQFGFEYCPWNKREHEFVQILANCTPIGMFPHVDHSPISKNALHSNMYVFDAVYNPLNTYLLRMAKEKGCKVVSGVEMFIRQACLQFRYFAGMAASGEFMKNLVLKALNDAKGC